VSVWQTISPRFRLSASRFLFGKYKAVIRNPKKSTGVSFYHLFRYCALTPRRSIVARLVVGADVRLFSLGLSTANTSAPYWAYQ